MKKITFLLAVIIVMISTMAFKANAIEVTFSSKAYWDGPTKSCMPREKGCCFHISFATVLDGQMGGDLTNNSSGLAFKISKTKGITPGVYKEFFSTGKFHLEGEGTFSEEILQKLGLPRGYVLKEGYYSIKEEGDNLTVYFK